MRPRAVSAPDLLWRRHPDTLFGLWSAALAPSDRLKRERQELILNVAGKVILLMMIPVIFTVRREPRLNAQGKDEERCILIFPRVLAAAGLAALLVILHLLSLCQMLV
jgi:hypothetical protein